jgi:thiol-disulfide isomerase/thioredoxin
MLSPAWPILLLLCPSVPAASSGDELVGAVRTAIAYHNLALAQQEIAAYRTSAGTTPSALEAMSWVARGALAEGNPDEADRWAAETRKLVLEFVKKRPFDSDTHLALALGASIEVQAQVLAGQGRRAEALTFLTHERDAWRQTSVGTRIQKNINLISLEGKPAPPLEETRWLGPKPASLQSLAGHPVLLFFWAHWCGDCKAEADAIARLAAEYRAQGLVVLGPTQRYGYAARGEEATPEAELQYIDLVRRQFYSSLADTPVPVSEQNFKVYGASTTPTLVLIDRRGLVRMYHPGAMPYAELAAAVQALIKRP